MLLRERVRLHSGDCLVVLDTMAENSVDAVVTDPPYELGFMGRAWDASGIAFCPQTWAKVLRVMKPGAHLVAFGAPKNYHRLACAIEDAGFEIRDSLMWVFGSGFPKSHNLGDDWQGWGTALKPAYEPIVLARKPLSEKTVAANVQRWGTGAINIGATRVETTNDLSRKNGGADALSWGGTYGAGKNEAAKRKDKGLAPLGRWPANLCHDGSDEVMAVFPYSKSVGGDGYKNSMFAGGKKTGGHGLGDEDSAARFFKSCAYGADECLDQSRRSAHAQNAELYSSLDDPLAVSALSHALEASTPRLALKSIDCREPNMIVSAQQLESVCELVITATTSLERRFSQGLPPERLSLSDSLASIVAIQEPTGIITITTSLWTSNGFAEAATLTTIETNLALGGGGSGVSRFKYCAKASKSDRSGSKHPTVKPVALMRWLCRMITPPNGVILDPFGGSGTTGQAAYEEGFEAVLIEREAEYAADIERRIESVGLV